MKILDSNKYGAASEESLAEFELNYSIPLPDDYKLFLLKHNGGKPEPSCFKIKKDISDVQIFYGLHQDKLNSLEAMLIMYKNRISHDFLPIASDSFGNQICLGLKGKSQNCIYFWNHDLEGSPQALTKVASSFNEFADSLFEWRDPDETFVEKIVNDNDIAKLKLLIMNGFDINQRDKDGISLLQDAVRLNRLEMVRVLIESGAELGDSLLIAKRNLKFFPEFEEITKYLESLQTK